ncbi:MAG: hypothetical protein WA883_11445 [Phormidesmis sp.]
MSWIKRRYHQQLNDMMAERSLADDFSQDCRPGRVMGSQSISGHLRQGADAENLLSIDNGALRIQPPITPGWTRAGIAYGPLKRQAGLALAIFMLNGHNTSEGNSREDSFKSRIWRWVRGSGTNPVADRLWRRSTSSQHQGTVRQFYRWARNHRRRFPKDGHIMENLALGWFSEAMPLNPTATGHSMVVRALGPENGELCTRIGGKDAKGTNRLTPAVQGLQNVQTYYIVLLTEQGAAYYAASAPNAKGLVAFPYMRLVGIDASRSHSESPAEMLHAGLFQSALGQVGFRVDTRVYDFQAKVLPALANWYGTAQTADALIADEAVSLAARASANTALANELADGAIAEIGGHWHSLKGTLEKTTQGLIACTKNSLALIDMPAPAGAVHVIVNTIGNAAGSAVSEPVKTVFACGLLWRTQDKRNSWGLFFESGQCQLKLQTEGKWAQIALEENYGLQGGLQGDFSDSSPKRKLRHRNAVQILDDGQSFSLYLNGQLLFDRWFTDIRLQSATQIGLFYESKNDIAFAQLEAHPREIPIPAEFDLSPPWQTAGSKTLVADSFAGVSQEIGDRATEVGNSQWQRTIGIGHMKLTGNGSLKVDASAIKPNPGRVAYTVAWENPTFADVSVDILPPGTARYQNEMGRGGLIFWQDADNYITVSQWLDDSYGGASVSSFFHIDGFEEIYDAVWTNVGTRIGWGQQQQFRIAFDGIHYTVYLAGEPVLYRALTDVYPRLQRLSIRRVGLVANWEWGNDTGTEFSQFVAKA